MKTISCFLLVAWLIPIVFDSYSQEKIDVEKYNIEIPDAPKKGKQRHAKITLINGQKLKGVITSIGDNSIQMEKVVNKSSRGVQATTGKSISYNEIYYNDIQSIKIRNLSATIGGSLKESTIGLLLGGALGFLLPLSTCNEDPDCFDSMLDSGLPYFTGIVGAGLGGLAGVVLGTDSGLTVFNVEGQYGNFQKFKNQMEKKKVKKK